MQQLTVEKRYLVQRILGRQSKHILYCHDCGVRIQGYHFGDCEPACGDAYCCACAAAGEKQGKYGLRSF